MKKMTRLNSKKLALSGLFLALALIISLIENMIPPLIPALPYAKIGLGNIVLLMCFLLIGVWEGYIVLFLKCVLAAVFAGNMAALIWSLPSAFLAYTVMVILNRTRIFSVTGLSVAGGMIHNLTQILVATLVIGQSVFAYLPYMLLAGGLAGLVTGVICQLITLRFINNAAVLKIAAPEYFRADRAENTENDGETDD